MFLAIDVTKPLESAGEKFAYGGQMLLIGMSVVFSVLLILWGALELFHVVVTKLPAAIENKRAKKNAPAPAEAASFALMKEQLMDVLDTLTPREEKVLRLRFGLDDGHQRTLEEVGKEFNVTRERIRQIEAKALRKLRHPSRSKKLRDYLD